MRLINKFIIICLLSLPVAVFATCPTLALTNVQCLYGKYEFIPSGFPGWTIDTTTRKSCTGMATLFYSKLDSSLKKDGKEYCTYDTFSSKAAFDTNKATTDKAFTIYK